jgi:hypothetical protein
MPIPVKGETFVGKERAENGVNKEYTITSVVNQPLPQDTGGWYLVFAHEIHRPIPEHTTEDGPVGGLEQSRFAIRWNPTLLRWEENNL